METANGTVEHGKYRKKKDAETHIESQTGWKNRNVENERNGTEKTLTLSCSI